MTRNLVDDGSDCTCFYIKTTSLFDKNCVKSGNYFKHIPIKNDLQKMLRQTAKIDTYNFKGSITGPEVDVGNFQFNKEMKILSIGLVWNGGVNPSVRLWLCNFIETK
jgi:hypothetical protein